MSDGKMAAFLTVVGIRLFSVDSGAVPLWVDLILGGALLLLAGLYAGLAVREG